KRCDKWESNGFSARYAAISQIGIAKWLRFHPEDTMHLSSLWPKVVDNRHKIKHIGDFALALWAGVASEADDCELFAGLLAASWQHQAHLCDATELGWIVQACTLALQEQGNLELHLQPVLDEAKERLVILFRPRQNLFQRHNRSGLRRVVNRRIACFADQVYPIMALSTYGLCFNDTESIQLAAGTVEQICRFQGSLGQWWWHYDVGGAKVCEEYPVFSVHQDAMAPMAIMASDKATGRNHSEEIELGMRWLFGANELGQNLFNAGQGIIWRDIEKCEPAKFSRALRAFLCVGDLKQLHGLAGRCFVGFRINRECRPYHLGWILYTWADYRLEG
ncbi:MAG: hypothetical protein ACYSWR_02355, partial [Planctomycetota bacterium]